MLLTMPIFPDVHLQKFYQIVTEDFRRDGGEPCVNSVKKLWNVVRNYGKTGTSLRNITSLIDCVKLSVRIVFLGLFW